MRKSPITIAIDATMAGLALLGVGLLLQIPAPWCVGVPLIFTPLNYFSEVLRDKKRGRAKSLG
jgi:hypothetical protein